MMTRQTTVVLAAMLIGLSCGCDRGKSGPVQPGPAGKGKIALSVLTLSNPFFKEIADTMAEEAKKHGYELVVVSVENDAATQQNQVKDFVVQKVSAIVLTPCDSRAVGQAIKEANAAGIPVFTADIACVAADAKVVSHIATDNHDGGKKAAEALFEAVGGKGKVAVIDHPVVESVMLRTKGFNEKLEELNQSKGGEVKVVAVLPGGGERDRSYRAAQDLLQAHGDLKGIFAINDPSALGAAAALETAGKRGQVAVVGFDGMPEGKKAIREGRIYADPIQFPDRIGRQTVQAIVAHFKGEAVPPQTLIATELYRKADAEKDPSIK